MVLGMSTPISSAQTTPPSTTERTTQEYFDEGVELVKVSKLGQAVSVFRQAYAVEKWPKTIFNIAAISERLNNTADAANAYAEYLSVTKGLPSSTPAAGERFQSQARTRLRALDKQLVVVAISSRDTGQVTVNNTTLGTAPGRWIYRVLARKKHFVVLDDGSRKKQEVLTGDKGETKTLVLVYPVAPTPVAPKPVAPQPDPDTSTKPTPVAPQPVVPQPDPDTSTKPTPTTANRGKTSKGFGAFGRIDINVQETGAVGVVGGQYNVLHKQSQQLDVTVALLLGRKVGVEPGARYLLPFSFTSRTIQPFLRLSVPIFFADGSTALGLRGAFGADIAVTQLGSSQVHVTVEFGGTHFVSKPDAFQSSDLLGALGLVVDF